MPYSNLPCARCTADNHPSSRFCASCGLPLGSAEPDEEAAVDVLGPYESPDPEDPDTARAIKQFVERSRYEASPAGHGWRLVVPMPKDRRQAVYVGAVGTDPAGRPLIAIVSVCGPANQRDAVTLLKLNALAVESHFAIKILRGEEYFVVICNTTVGAIDRLDAPVLVRRIAAMSDGLEDRLTRGRDLF